MPSTVSTDGPRIGERGRGSLENQASSGSTSYDASAAFSARDFRTRHTTMSRDDDDGSEYGCAATDVLLDRLVGVRGEVPEEDAPGAPDDATERIEEQEPSVGHEGSARQCRHDRSEERREPTEEDGPAPPLGQEAVGVVEPVLVASQWFEVKEPTPEDPAHLIADGVAEDRRSDHDDDGHDEVCVALAGCDTREDGGGLTRQHEADEQRIFGEDERKRHDVDDPRGDVEELVDEAAHWALGPTRKGSMVAGRMPAASASATSAGTSRTR